MSKEKTKKEKTKKENEEVKEEIQIEETPTENNEILDVNKADNLLSEMVNDMPEVNDEAIQSAQEEIKQQKENPSLIYRDRYGRNFDPNIHGTGADGKPLLTRDGNLRVVRRKAKGGINIPQQTQDFQNVQLDAKRRVSAEMLANMYIQGGISLFGDDWKPEKQAGYDEREFLVQATDDYFKEAGFVEPPAWAVIIMAYGMYGIKRLSKPRVKTTFQRAVEGTKKLITKLFRKRGKNGAYVNSGDNRERKNDAGVQNGESVQTETNSGLSS